jgi:hypothetical protein
VNGSLVKTGIPIQLSNGTNLRPDKVQGVSFFSVVSSASPVGGRLCNAVGSVKAG